MKMKKKLILWNVIKEVSECDEKGRRNEFHHHPLAEDDKKEEEDLGRLHQILGVSYLSRFFEIFVQFRTISLAWVNSFISIRRLHPERSVVAWNGLKKVLLVLDPGDRDGEDFPTLFVLFLIIISPESVLVHQWNRIPGNRELPLIPR